jgi:hypothetical protein
LEQQAAVEKGGQLLRNAKVGYLVGSILLSIFVRSWVGGMGIIQAVSKVLTVLLLLSLLTDISCARWGGLLLGGCGGCLLLHWSAATALRGQATFDSRMLLMHE